MSAANMTDPKVLLFIGAGASDALGLSRDPESVYKHYLPLLSPLKSCDIVSLFTVDEAAGFESFNEYRDAAWHVEPVTAGEQPIFSAVGKPVLSLYSPGNIPGYYKGFEKSLRPGAGKLLVVTGYAFSDTKINDIMVKGIEDGARLLLLDAVVQYKQLAEYLRVTDIKHKARIEKMEFGDWNDAKVKLLSGIIRDELRRLEP